MTTASDQHNLVHMSSDIKETAHSKFHALLRDQIRNEFNASHQYIATAVYFANVDLPQLAKHFYAQAVEERNHAMMIVQYFLDRDITVELNEARLHRCTRADCPGAGPGGDRHRAGRQSREHRA